jgi:hypothetical protein
MYINRGEKPDMVAIESILDKEFSEWREKLGAMVEKLCDSKLQFDAAKMSDSNTNTIRCEYLKAVKKLHPDLNPNLPQAAKDLWNEIQAAYAARDWAAVRLLASLVESVASGKEDFASAPDAVAALREACEGLEAKSRELVAESARIQKESPFTYKEFLADEEAVVARQNELKMDIAELKAKIAKCEEEWNNG